MTVRFRFRPIGVALRLLILTPIALILAACSSSRVPSPEGDAFMHQLDSLHVIAVGVEAEGDTIQMAAAWRTVATQAASPPSTLSAPQQEQACTYAERALEKLSALAMKPYTSDGLNVRGTDVHYYIDGELFWPTTKLAKQVQDALRCR